MTRLAVVLGLMLVWPLISVASAQAADFSADGTAAVSSKTQSFQVTEGHTLLLSMTEQSVTTNDPQSPLNGVSGPCYGEININAAGPDGDGYCSWIDGGGEKHLVSWAATRIDEAGQLSGTWKIEQGQGKWQGASGGGNWQFVTTGEGDAAVIVNHMTGTIHLK